ncbi:MAG: hypothetical protein WEA61_04900 [Anaerolineales bacterium]
MRPQRPSLLRTINIGLAILALLSLAAVLLLPQLLATQVTEAPQPPDARSVASLELVVSSNELGFVEIVELMGFSIANSYAPNVFDTSGPWSVELYTAAPELIREYNIQDPREVHVEEDEGEVPHGTFNQPMVEWTLVIPLFDDEVDLNVEAILIRDENGDIIFAIEPGIWAALEKSAQGDVVRGNLLTCVTVSGEFAEFRSASCSR